MNKATEWFKRTVQSNLKKQAESSTIDKGPRTFSAEQLRAQIGGGNILAVSGGRIEVHGNGLRLPVAYGYAVDVFLEANDTYTVQTVFTRSGVTSVKHEWTDVYAQEVGEAVYQASLYRDLKNARKTSSRKTAMTLEDYETMPWDDLPRGVQYVMEGYQDEADAGRKMVFGLNPQTGGTELWPWKGPGATASRKTAGDDRTNADLVRAMMDSYRNGGGYESLNASLRELESRGFGLAEDALYHSEGQNGSLSALWGILGEIAESVGLDDTVDFIAYGSRKTALNFPPQDRYKGDNPEEWDRVYQEAWSDGYFARPYDVSKATPGSPYTRAYYEGVNVRGYELEGKPLYFSKRKTASRPIYEIAEDISREWKNVNYAAKPYLDAMYSLSDIGGNYGADSAKSVVAYFLSNASSFRGEKAKALKAELKALGSKTAASRKTAGSNNLMYVPDDGGGAIMNLGGLSLSEFVGYLRLLGHEGGYITNQDGGRKDLDAFGSRRTAKEWTPEEAWAVVGNQHTENLRMMQKALSSLPLMNSPAMNDRLDAANYILDGKVRNPRYHPVAASRKTAKQVYTFEPVGLDAFESRPHQPAPGTRVIISDNLHGGPRNGTMGHVYIENADTGEWYGLALKNSLVKASKRALNEQSGHAESDLDDVEVNDDNADEEAMWPWEIGKSTESSYRAPLNVWAQNSDVPEGSSNPEHVEVDDEQAQESMFDEGWAESASKTALNMKWVVLQRGTFVQSAGPFDSEAEAQEQADAQNLRHNTNEYVVMEVNYPVTAARSDYDEWNDDIANDGYYASKTASEYDGQIFTMEVRGQDFSWEYDADQDTVSIGAPGSWSQDWDQKVVGDQSPEEAARELASVWLNDGMMHEVESSKTAVDGYDASEFFDGYTVDSVPPWDKGGYTPISPDPDVNDGAHLFEVEDPEDTIDAGWVEAKTAGYYDNPAGWWVIVDAGEDSGESFAGEDGDIAIQERDYYREQGMDARVEWRDSSSALNPGIIEGVDQLVDRLTSSKTSSSDKWYDKGHARGLQMREWALSEGIPLERVPDAMSGNRLEDRVPNIFGSWEIAESDDERPIMDYQEGYEDGLTQGEGRGGGQHYESSKTAEWYDEVGDSEDSDDGDAVEDEDSPDKGMKDDSDDSEGDDEDIEKDALRAFTRVVQANMMMETR